MGAEFHIPCNIAKPISYERVNKLPDEERRAR